MIDLKNESCFTLRDTDRFRVSMDFGEWDQGFIGLDKEYYDKSMERIRSIKNQ